MRYLRGSLVTFRNETGAKRIFNNYEALEELRAFFAGRGHQQTSDSGSHGSQGHQFRDEAQYLDASSDDGMVRRGANLSIDVSVEVD